MKSNNIIAFFVGLIVLYYHSLYRGMCIKATIVAYAFSLQYFENTTIIAYVGLRITMKINGMHMHIYISLCQ